MFRFISNITASIPSRILDIVLPLVSLLLIVLIAAACWSVFSKAGEKGWKILIPVYNRYVGYKISWSGTAYWVRLLLVIAAGVLFVLAAGHSVPQLLSAAENAGIALPADVREVLLKLRDTAVLPSRYIVLSCILASAAALISLIRAFKLSRAFGHGFWFFLGLLILPYLFILILGFGKYERYAGPYKTVTVEKLQSIL